MKAKIAENVDVSSGRSGNAYRFILLMLGEAALLLFLFFLARLQDMSLDVGFWFYDPVSAAIVYGTPFIMLLIAGLLPDFFRSFLYSLKRSKDITVLQLKKSIISVKLTMAAAVSAELFLMAFLFVSMMTDISTVSGGLEDLLPVSLAVFGGNAVYGILAVVILLPVYARLKVRLIAME